MADIHINQMVDIMDYANRPGIFAVFSDYDRDAKTGVLRFISTGFTGVPRKLRKKYKDLCTINTIPINDSVEYDIDE